MSTISLVKRRVKGGAGPGVPTVVEGQLAYNEAGASIKTTGNAQSVDDLWIGGDGDAAKILVSNLRQVEVTGDQLNITGLKSFRKLSFGGTSSATAASFPTSKGSAGQVLKMNAAATALEFVASAGVSIKSVTVADSTGGSIHANFNAITDFAPLVSGNPVDGGLVIADTEIWIITDTESATAFIWIGGSGTFGSGTTTPGTVVTDAMFTPLGAATTFADKSEVEAGTAKHKAIDPIIAKAALIVASNAGTDIPQTLANTLTVSADLTMGADILMAENEISGTDATHRFTINQADIKVAAAVTLSAAVTGIMVGDATTANQLDKFIFDAGTF